MALVQTKAEIAEGMNRIAHLYRFMAFVLSLGRVPRAIRRQLNSLNADSICVLGCGDGLGLERGLRTFRRVRLIDLSEEMLQRARRRFGEPYELVQGDENSIDDSELVYLPFVLNLYREEELPVFSRSLWNAMDDGQDLIVTDFNPSSGKLSKAYLRLLYMGFGRLTKTSITTLGDYPNALRNAGFEPLEETLLDGGLISLSRYRKGKVKNSHQE